MKLILIALVAIGFCLLLAPEVAGEDALSTTEGNDGKEVKHSPKKLSSFFSFLVMDPCAVSLFQMLNVTDAKCSLMCFIQAGQQQGGYCENSECQCNQIG